MTVDPATSLAVSMHATKGAYALLLGSGVSGAARVPTGWAVVVDLIRRIARLEGAVCEPDPAQWYRDAHGEEPDYGRLLDALGRTQPERSRLIRAYIEPTEEERTLGLKQATEAHRAIAELVAGGYLRVIVTTNFDRLIETALRDAGIELTVIDSVDALRGSLPLVHTRCAVVKLHGDYVDARIRNTAHELERYPGPINGLLDRILEEYGLVVCGWSGDWDPALRHALERRRSQWFSTFWALRREPGGAAAELIAARGAEVVRTADADQSRWGRLVDLPVDDGVARAPVVWPDEWDGPIADYPLPESWAAQRALLSMLQVVVYVHKAGTDRPRWEATMRLPGGGTRTGDEDWSWGLHATPTPV